MSEGLTFNSRRVYSFAVNRFLNFCSMYLLNPFSLDELLILRFITYLADSGVAPSTVRVYLAGIRAWLINGGSHPPIIYTQRIKWALKAMERVAPLQSRVKPFSYSLFWDIIAFIFPSYDNKVCFTAMLLGYFACLRAAEYVWVPGSTQPLMPAHLRFVDSVPPHAVVSIQSSKTAHRGFDVAIGCTGTTVCAVCWLKELHMYSLPPHSPIFSLRDGTLLSRARLAHFMQGALRAAGLDPNGYSPHSLRAGAATDAAGLGFTEAQIQALGRWKSDAFRLYIRPSQRHQAGLSSRLAMTSSRGHLH